MLVLLVVFLLIAPPSARADGDPASDVLTTQSVFLAGDAGVPLSQQTRISDLLAQVARAGHPIRVAIIASPSDLGSVAVLWRHPEAYARFLGEELSLTYLGTLLVVMPNGQAAEEVGPHPSVSPPIRPHPARRLGEAAINAIRQVAAAAHLHLAIPAATRPVTTQSTTSPIPWLVFGAGWIILIAVWTASLRAKPLRLGSRL